MAGTGTKRITELTEASTIQNGDFIAVDSNARGTKKVSTNTLATSAALTAETNARAGADEAEQTAREEADDALTESVTALSDEVTAQGELIQNPTKTVSGSLVSFTDGADMPAKSVIVNIEPQQSGTGTPSPDNVRQISGWESVSVTDAGKNMANMIADGTTPSISTGALVFYAQSTRSQMIRVNPSTAYVASFGNTLLNGIFQYDKDGNFIRVDQTPTATTIAVTTTNTTAFIMLRCDRNSTSDPIPNCQFELGTTATSYTPYIGTTTPVNLGRTVYGGTLDVVSGVLTVDRAMVDLGTLNWTRVSTFGGSFLTTVNDMKENVANVMCSAYPTVNTGAEMTASNSAVYAKNNGWSVYVKDNAYTDAATFKTAMNGVQLVYELATPQTYTLTPTEVNTLLGENNVWADAGAVEVTYRRDISIVINNLESALNG